jgi:hypothetical protein
MELQRVTAWSVAGARPSPAISRKMRPMRRLVVHGLLLAVVLGCTPTTPTAGPSVGVEGTPELTAPSASLEPRPSPAPSAAVGFAFDPESIVGYYQGLGYTCTDPGPSAQAEGYLYRSCRLVDPEGRTRIVGLVTDPADDLADAFASVQGKQDESVLDPNVALEPLAAFLGATLGTTQGETLLPWLAGHLGDAYSKTSLADLTIATYTATADDHSKLSVEIANQAYLDAPPPSASP